MTVERGTFAGVGAVAIHWERAAPASAPPRAAVVVAHGYAEHFARYGELVRHLTDRGLAVAGMDHRGHGRSEGPRGHCASIDEFIADMRTLADKTAAWWPGVPRLLFGHSMGGLLGFVYLLRHPDTVRAAALSAPALRIPDPPLPLQLLARVLGRVAPGVGFRSKLDATLLSRDPAVGEAYVADPLVHRRASAGLVRAINAAQAEAFAGAATLRVPLLILQGDADRIVDPGGSRDVAARLTGPHELVMLPGYYHELLNEIAPDRARVYALLDAWFDRWLST